MSVVYCDGTVLEIRSKCRMDKCPSIIILGQTISDLLGHILHGEVHMCHSRCASTNNESMNRHSLYERLGITTVCVKWT